MPNRAFKYCKALNCEKITSNKSGYCDKHQYISEEQQHRVNTTLAKPDIRPSSAKRGYDREWRKIREQVLIAHGIPRSQWKYWVVDHRPRYNPEVDPDHTHYQLVPMRKEDHSRKTVHHDGGLGRPKR